MFKGGNLANYVFKDRNPFRNKFQRWCVKHRLIHALDHQLIIDDQTNEAVGALMLYEGNKFLLGFLNFVTSYHFGGNVETIRVKNDKIVG